MTAQALEHLIVAFVRALESSDLLFLDKFLTPDVVYVRLNPRSNEFHGKEEVIGRMEPFLRAFVGWSFNASDLQADPAQRTVMCSLHISGANQGEMDFRAIGQGHYEATGKSFALPPGRLTLSARGAQIQRIEIEFAEGGGLVGIFEQIGPHR
jgi:SnoaL-like domain